VHIRKIFPAEVTQLSHHLARLTREQRSLRFMGYLDDAAVAKHCARINWLRTVVIGCFDGGVLRGAAELDVAHHQFPILCEVAITVETAWQERGVATDLLRRVVVIARNRTARGVQVNCFSDNYRIQRIAQKFGASFRSRFGESAAEIPTPGPTYWSLCEEWIDDGIGWMSVCFDQIAAQTRIVLLASGVLPPAVVRPT
jgi:RimJ/RimL family protein N-acetyltransferase